MTRLRQGVRRRAGHAPSRCLFAAAALALVGAPAAAGQEAAPDTASSRPVSPFAHGLPTPAELEELVAYAEPVAADPHDIRLESWRGDTISGVFLVDSDEPTARHVAFGRDASGFRYVWFSRRNPLRASLVAMYQVDDLGAPDVLYWRQIDYAARAARAREFRGPAAAEHVFEYSAGPPCGRGPCEGWVDLPLERVAVDAEFFEPLLGLYRAAAEHGEPWLDQPRASLEPAGLSRGGPPAQTVASG